MRNFFILYLFAGVIISFTAFGQWEPIPGPYANLEIYELKQKDSILLASTECGLFIQDGQGREWYKLNPYYTPNLEFKGDSLFTSFYHGYGIANLANKPVQSVNFPSVGSPFINGPSIAIQDTMMFVSSWEGVYISHDWGATSQQYLKGLDVDTSTYNGNTYYQLSVFDVITNGLNVYCATAKGVYRSDFDLSGWALKSNGLHGNVIRRMHHYGNSLYAQGVDTIYRSTDNGENWSAVYGGTSRFISDFCVFNNKLYVSDLSLGVLVSSDNGLTWQQANMGLTTPSVKGLEGDGSNLYVFNHEGFYKWDGTSWQLQNGEGLFCTRTASVQATSKEVTLTQWEGVHRLNNDGTYADITPRVGRGWSYGVSRVYRDTLFVPARYIAPGAGVDSCKVFYTANGGVSWNPIDGPTFSSSYVQVNTDIRFYSDTMYLMGDGELFYSPDMGQSWVDISPVALSCNSIDDIIHVNGKLYLAGCKVSWIYKYDKSTNEWNRALDFPTGFAVGFMQRDSAIFVNYENEIKLKFPSSPWTLAYNGLSQFYIYTYLNLNQNLFISTSAGVFQTNNYGGTWRDFNNGWTDPGRKFPVNISTLGDTMYVATYYEGIYKQAIPPNPVSLNEFSSADGMIKLYPNPASDVLTINSEKEGQGTYKIYDQSGKLMMEGEFKNGQNIGVYQLNAGMYIVKLIQGKISSEHKLLIK